MKHQDLQALSNVVKGLADDGLVERKGAEDFMQQQFETFLEDAGAKKHTHCNICQDELSESRCYDGVCERCQYDMIGGC